MPIVIVAEMAMCLSALVVIVLAPMSSLAVVDRPDGMMRRARSLRFLTQIRIVAAISGIDRIGERLLRSDLAATRPPHGTPPGWLLHFLLLL